MPKYLVKTANFVAEIGSDEELAKLAEVDTIQKDTFIKMLPNGDWIEAKKWPPLRKIWGLEIALMPMPAAIPKPSESSLGIHAHNAGSAPSLHTQVKAVSHGGSDDRPPSVPRPPRLETVIDYAPRFPVQPEPEDEAAPSDEIQSLVLEHVDPSQISGSLNVDYQSLSSEVAIVIDEEAFLDIVPDQMPPPSPLGARHESAITDSSVQDIAAPEAELEAPEVTRHLAEAAVTVKQQAGVQHTSPDEKVTWPLLPDADMFEESSPDDVTHVISWPPEENWTTTGLSSENPAEADDVSEEAPDKRVRFAEQEALASISTEVGMAGLTEDEKTNDLSHRVVEVRTQKAIASALDHEQTNDLSLVREQIVSESNAQQSHEMTLRRDIIESATTAEIPGDAVEKALKQFDDVSFESPQEASPSSAITAQAAPTSQALKMTSPVSVIEEVLASEAPQPNPVFSLSASELSAVRVALNTLQQCVPLDDPTDQDALRRAVSLVSALEASASHEALPAVTKEDSESDATNADVPEQEISSDDAVLEEGISERFKVFQRDELETMMRSGSDHSPVYKAQTADVDEDESSDKLKIRKQSELRRLLVTAEYDSVSINLPIAREEPISGMPPGEVRQLFEQENELHIYLENVIRDRESEAGTEGKEESRSQGNEQERRSGSGLRSAPVFAPKVRVVPKPEPERTNVTRKNSFDMPMSQENPEFAQRFFEEDETELARFYSLCLTNRRLWSIEAQKNHLRTYESYNLENIQWVALREEKNWAWLIINVLGILAMVIAMLTIPRTIFLVLLIYAFFMLPICYLASFRTMIQVGLSNTTLRGKHRITRANRDAAMKFLNKLELARSERQRAISQGDG